MEEEEEPGVMAEGSFVTSAKGGVEFGGSLCHFAQWLVRLVEDAMASSVSGGAHKGEQRSRTVKAGGRRSDRCIYIRLNFPCYPKALSCTSKATLIVLLIFNACSKEIEDKASVPFRHFSTFYF